MKNEKYDQEIYDLKFNELLSQIQTQTKLEVSWFLLRNVNSPYVNLWT